jgi:hypothetical protein
LRFAIGWGFLLCAAAAPSVAAEWSMTSLYSWSVDHDSNRTLNAGVSGSESTVLTADLRFERALEDLQLTVEPRYSWRRYSDSLYGNGDDRSLYAGLAWERDLSRLDLTASIWDQSTLLTELLETGLVRADSHRRLVQAGANWVWAQTERRQMVGQLQFSDTHYYGQGSQFLPGYQYPSGSLGERFVFSERGDVTVSAYGSYFTSQAAGNTSRELGLQAAIDYQFSERTKLNASLGQSSRRLAGASSSGTDASLLLRHDFLRASISLAYTRSLVPYGFGFLVERQQATLSGVRHLTEHFDANFSVFRIQNNETAVLLNLARRSYDNASVGLSWRPWEEWRLGAQLTGTHTQLPGLSHVTVNEWRGSLSLVWTPRRIARSW